MTTQTSLAMLDPRVGPTNAGVIDPATVEKIIDECLRCTDRIDGLDWARIGSRRGGEESTRVRWRLDDQRLV